MKIKTIIGALGLLACAATSAFADQNIADLRAKLDKSMPGITIDSLRATQVPGLYEMVSGPDVAYVTADGVHMIQGTLYNVQSRKNLTEQSLSVSRVKLMQTIDPASLMVYPAVGKEKHAITVFTDPSCGYCRALHAEIPKLNELGITVKYALYARNGNGTLTGRQLTEVLCSTDQKAELTKFFNASTRDVKGAECRKAEGLERIARLAPQVGLKGTPHIVTDKGVAFSGYQPAQELLRTLQGS
ncbi:disulfide isomerase DsbC N-terminal domain-containing protein [Acidovorax sp. sic0104]|uniref:disulfide isomerase DsbC N-terminal domain-containing protein n=1 Tax=Acidovorax sp. sic0104 TaxID=2854784 RepID=UPI001C47E632|nr:disulfide isomerase DsbC N-terminal domain-containing protein [Acidovorax sp. sic0104]MBV7542120.1 thioredoxin fold domain-containing protein [Acidovorax sp. sic0104]